MVIASSLHRRVVVVGIPGLFLPQIFFSHTFFLYIYISNI